jgi:hypothetical protein
MYQPTFLLFNQERRAKISPTGLIEATLDLALTTGLLAAVGFSLVITTRLVVRP